MAIKRYLAVFLTKHGPKLNMRSARIAGPARRIEDVQTPIIPVVGDWIRQNPGTISLGQGIVHYPPPPVVFDRLAARYADPEMHKYGPVVGIEALRDRIRSKLLAENGMETVRGGYDVVVTAGSNMGFLNAVLAITDPGDEIVLLTPFYFNHEMAVGIAGCNAVTVKTDQNFQPLVGNIMAALTPRTRAVVTISPNNPTGTVYSREILEAINALCSAMGIFHIHDEAYEYFTYEGIKNVSPGSFEGAERHTISLYSLSKAYGFASWRIGYMVLPVVLLEAVRKIQDTNVICPPIISQEAAVAALDEGRSYCEHFVSKLTDVRSLVLAELEDLGDLVRVPRPDGAFYVLIHVDTQLTDIEVTRMLIDQFGVAVIPGSAFGLGDGCYLRIAYGALEQKTVELAMGRLVTGLKTLRRPKT